jgi:hypothetical protein
MSMGAPGGGWLVSGFGRWGAGMDSLGRGGFCKLLKVMDGGGVRFWPVACLW